MPYRKFPLKKSSAKKLSETIKQSPKLKITNLLTQTKPPKNLKYSNNQKMPNMGDFKERITRLLEGAKTPLNTASIGKRLKKSQEFVFVWLASVGKSIPEIKKVSIDKYIYESKNNS